MTASILDVRARQSSLDDDLLCALVVSQLRATRMTLMMNDPWKTAKDHYLHVLNNY